MKKTTKTIRSIKMVVAVTTTTAIMPVNSPSPDDDAIELVDNVKSTNRVVVGATPVGAVDGDDVAVVVVGSRHVHRASLHVFCDVTLLHGTLPLAGSLHSDSFNAQPASTHVASSEISEQNTLAPPHIATTLFTNIVVTSNVAISAIILWASLNQSVVCRRALSSSFSDESYSDSCDSCELLSSFSAEVAATAGEVVSGGAIELVDAGPASIAAGVVVLTVVRSNRFQNAALPLPSSMSLARTISTSHTACATDEPDVDILVNENPTWCANFCGVQRGALASISCKI